jgi:hypothetical protein
MKLTTFTYHGTTRPGIVIGNIDGIGYIENPVVEEPADTVRL